MVTATIGGTILLSLVFYKFRKWRMERAIKEMIGTQMDPVLLRSNSRTEDEEPAPLIRSHLNNATGEVIHLCKILPGVSPGRVMDRSIPSKVVRFATD